MVYISSLNRVHGVHLARLGLAFPSFSGIGHVGGVRVPVVVHGQEEHSDSIICRRFGIGDFSFVFVFCVDARIFCVLLWVVCGLLVNGIAESVSYNMAAVRRRPGDFTGGVFTGFLSLLGVFPWRLWLHLLLYASRCLSVPCNWGTHSYCAKTRVVIRNYALRS